MLLEALVACAGVTLSAVATALGIALDGGTVTAEGDLDFRGTLGVAKDAPVGFREIRLSFDLRTAAPAEQVAKLRELTERYCVVYQTLAKSPPLTVSHRVQSPLRGIPIVLSALLGAAAAAPARPQPLVLDGATVIDVESGRAQPGLTVIVEGERIARSAGDRRSGCRPAHGSWTRPASS
jgi:uncharacterized OsmC-like protein